MRNSMLRNDIIIILCNDIIIIILCNDIIIIMLRSDIIILAGTSVTTWL